MVIAPDDAGRLRSAALAQNKELRVRADVTFPEPVFSNRRLVRSFLELHRALELRAGRLVRHDRLADWLRAVLQRSSTPRPDRSQVTSATNERYAGPR
jgi:hypothetical protein